MAKTWAPKFNYVSPVWLQIKRQSPNIYIISGLHDVDHAWMKSLRQKGSDNNLKSKPNYSIIQQKSVVILISEVGIHLYTIDNIVNKQES